MVTSTTSQHSLKYYSQRWSYIYQQIKYNSSDTCDYMVPLSLNSVGYFIHLVILFSKLFISVHICFMFPLFFSEVL